VSASDLPFPSRANDPDVTRPPAEGERAAAEIGPYRLLRRIGEGGMGEVWLATDVPLDRTVALKLLPAEVTQDPARVSRFEREARAASALNHPNVCTILGLGQTADERHYIAMEHVDGATLRARLAASLAIPDALDIAI